MTRHYYYVSPSKAGWQITMDNDNNVWTYATKQQALDAAVAAARDTHLKGRKSGVKVQLGNGQWQEERTYGDDPFPPKG